jgi:hypothetical protein
MTERSTKFKTALQNLPNSFGVGLRPLRNPTEGLTITALLHPFDTFGQGKPSSLRLHPLFNPSKRFVLQTTDVV